jgi:hypothetical protein
MGYLWQRVVDTIRSTWPLTYLHRELDDLFADMMNFVPNIIFCIKLITLIKYGLFIAKSCWYHQESLTINVLPLRTWWPLCRHDEFRLKWHNFKLTTLKNMGCLSQVVVDTIRSPWPLTYQTWWPFCRHAEFCSKYYFLDRNWPF